MDKTNEVDETDEMNEANEANEVNEVNEADEANEVKDFCEMFRCFIMRTMVATEEGLYSLVSDRKALKDSTKMLPLMVKLTETLYNSVYDDLLREQKQTRFGKMFDQLAKMLPSHSPNCMINIACRLVCLLHPRLPRSQLDVSSSRADYVSSVELAVDQLIPPIAGLMPFFTHTCNGGPIQPLPAGQKMFYLG